MTPTANLKNQEKGHCAPIERKKLNHGVHHTERNPVPDERTIDIPFKLKQEMVKHLQYPKMQHAMNILLHRLCVIRERGFEGQDWRVTLDDEIEVNTNLYSKKTFGMLVIRFASDEKVTSWNWKGKQGREVRLKKAPLPYCQNISISTHSMQQYLRRRGNRSRIHAFPEIVNAYVEEEMTFQTKFQRSWYNGRQQWLLPLPQFGVVAVFIHDVNANSIVMTTTLSILQAELQALTSNPWKPSKALLSNIKTAVKA